MRTNRGQVFLYQEHFLSLATDVHHLFFAGVDDSGIIYLVGILYLASDLYHKMHYNKFAKL